jgi:hypothetical protein
VASAIKIPDRRLPLSGLVKCLRRVGENGAEVFVDVFAVRLDVRIDFGSVCILFGDRNFTAFDPRNVVFSLRTGQGQKKC